MDPAHAVFSNQELLRMICQTVYEGSQLRCAPQCMGLCPLETRYPELHSLAFVCRAISDMALDVLWSSVHLKYLYCAFPRNIVYRNGRGIKSFTRDPVTLQQWSRFSVHARRVRKLIVANGKSDVALSAALAHYPRPHHPFPHLTCLKLKTTSKLVTKAKAFICPTLTDVSLSIDFDDEGYGTVIDILQAVTETCLCLWRFKYKEKVKFKSRINSLDNALTLLIRHFVHLQSVKVPGSRNVLDALSRLPSLSKLDLYHFSCDNKQQPQSESWREQEPLDQERFRVLECLDIDCLAPLDIVVGCIRGMGCFPRTELRLCLPSSAPLSTPDVEQFLRAVLHPNRSVELRTFEVFSSGEERNIATVPWQPFWKLLSTTHVQNVAFDALDVDIDDSDLKAISSTMRELKFLAFYPTARSISRITFQGLAHLASLPNLEHVSLTMRDDATISQSMLPTEKISTSPLASLQINGKLVGVSVFQVTLFLVKYFPKLTSVDSSQKGLEFARQVLHPLPES